MSIINLEKTFENGQLVYCNIDNKIIECSCLTKLFKHWKKDYDNEDLGTFVCDKVKVITIYDIYKNIIYEPIQTNLFKNQIKINTIFKDLIKNIFFFKTFIGAFIKNNKLNGIKYYTNDKGYIYKILYDNISLKIINYIKFFNVYNNEKKCIHKLFLYKKDSIIYYKDNNYLITYSNNIKISNGKYPFYQTIYCCKKNLKILSIHYEYKDIEKIYEKRNNNNEIKYLIEYENINKIKEEFFSNDIDPPFSKPLRKFCIELIDYYNKNINNYNELIKYLLKKEKKVYNNLLLNSK